MIKKLYSNLINSLNGLKIVSKENSFILELVLGVFLIPYIFLSNIDLNYKIILSVLYFLLLVFSGILGIKRVIAFTKSPT